MRIERLDLSAFGHFTNRSLDFTPASRRLQIVYGENAAGKTTALRAVTDLLFGIPERTTDSFLHGTTALRIGAVLRSRDGQPLEIVRRKGRQNTLLTPSGDPLPPARLSPFLGGADRRLFELTFGLGHERLRQGAEDILRAGGALGESLFEAAGGTASVRQLLAWLDDEAGKIFRARASNPALNAAVARYQEAHGSLRKVALGGDELRSLEREMRELAQKRAGLDERLAELQRARQRLDRIQRNLPRLARYNVLQSSLAEIGQVPELPPEAAEARIGLLSKQAELARAIAKLSDAVTKLEGDLEQIEVPQDLLAAEEIIKDLAATLGEHRKACRDLPKVRGQASETYAEARRLLSEARPGLDIGLAESVRIPEPKRRRIQELTAAHTGLCAELQATDKALQDARLLFDQARQDLENLPRGRDARKLSDAVRAVRAEGPLDGQIGEAEAATAGLKQRLDAALLALPFWNASAEDLERAAVPMPESVRAFGQRLRDGEAIVTRLRDELGREKEDLAKIRKERERLTNDERVPTPEQRDAARKRREEGWQLIRRGYVDSREDVSVAAADFDSQRPLPEAYEETVRSADNLADRMNAEATLVASYQSLKLKEQDGAERISERTAALEQAEADRRQVEEEWIALWAAAGIEPGTPAEMSEWMIERRAILEVLDSLRKESERAGVLRARREAARHQLATALAELGEPELGAREQLGVLLACAERRAEEEQDTAARRATQEELIRERATGCERLRTSIPGLQQQLEDWSAEWRQEIEPLGFALDVSPTEVDSAVALLSRAFQKLDEASSLHRRISRMEEDWGGFSQRVSAIAATLAPDLTDTSPEQVVAELQRRLSAALRGATSRSEKESRLAEQREALAEAERDLTEANEKLRDWLCRAQCSTPEEMEAAEKKIEKKRELERDLRNITEQLTDADANGQLLNEVIEETAAQDGDRAAAELAELESRSRALNEERDQCVARIGELQRDLQEKTRNSDLAAQAAQDAQSEAAAIRSLAEQYARLRLAELVLRDFIERYRERHKDPMLVRASQLFSKLTLGTFTGLRTDFDDNDQPILVGITRTGGACGVQAMSDGTRDQLYLALRLAAVEQHVASAEPLPFIADDLLVHFDDERASAAFEVLAEFSNKTQVLFFTHHRHLIELASKAVPADVLSIQEI